jgi:tRNA modification GTPase
MNEPARDTIFALSSGRPPAAIAVIRVAGPRARAALEALGVKVPEPRRVGLARFRDPASGEIIDEGLVLFFEGAKSEIGEDTAELQPHGGRAIIAAMLAALGRIEGLRPAEAGEFTRRAFENGKMDLTAVEGLADLVMAETEGQRRQAYRQMRGALGKQADAWRERLIQALALVEARIDFSDEGDVPEDLLAPALAIAGALEAEIAGALADGQRGERLRDGLTVAIAGPPNAGKSTLLNRIARREAAIVSPYAGTTRDVIEVHLDLGGMPVTLLDTAGIRDTDNPVEMEGVRRARQRAAAADLVLWVVDASAPEVFSGEPEALLQPPPARSLDAGAAQAAGIAMQAADIKSESVARSWLVVNKCDLNQEVTKSLRAGGAGDRSEAKGRFNETITSMVNKHLTSKNESVTHNSEPVFSISALSGDGVPPLLGALERFAADALAGADAALVTRARHRRALEETLAALRRAVTRPVAEREDLLAEELHGAARALGRLTGRVDVEDILDVIFRDFCIGK